MRVLTKTPMIGTATIHAPERPVIYSFAAVAPVRRSSKTCASSMACLEGQKSAIRKQKARLRREWCPLSRFVLLA